MIINALNIDKCWLGKYYLAIQNKERIVGLEMYMGVENLINDILSGEYIYDTENADIRIDFIENCIRLTKDPFYGQLMILDLFQKAWVEAFYSFKFLDDPTKDRFVETLLLIARKNGKSELCSALLLTELIIGGEGVDIVCGSNDDAQANILFEACDKMRLMIDPTSVDTWRNQKGMRCKINQNWMYKLTERKRNKEGYNISVAVLDEVHEMKNNSLYKPVEQSVGVKKNYKIFIITTEGFVNDGFLDNLLIEYRKVLKKEDTSYKAIRRLPWLYTMDSEDEVWETDENGISRMWEKANPGIGRIKTWDYLKLQVADGKNSKMNRPFVLSKDFNFKVANSESWLQISDYNYTSEYIINNIDRYVGVGAVDLSESKDMTSAKIYCVKKDDKHKYVLSHYWICSAKLDECDDSEAGAKYREWESQGLLTIQNGTHIDLSAVADWIYEMTEKYDIYLYKTGYDRKYKTEWVKRMEYYGWLDGEDLVEINQRPDRLHEHIYQVERDLQHRLICGLNEIDKWCLGNSSLKRDSNGKVILQKMDNKRSHRIDGAASLVIAEATYDLFKTDIVNEL